MKKFLCFLMLCSALAAAQDKSQIKAAEKAIMDADRAFCQATLKDGAAGWTSYFAPNAVILGEPPQVGVDAIRADAEKRFGNKRFKLEWEPVRAEVFPSGDFGYTVGRWTRTGVNKEGKQVTMHGMYLTTWQKQKDGSWKIVADGGSANPQPPAQTSR